MKSIYDTAIKIRAFEETVLELFGQGKISGTTHTYIGAEATASSLMQFIHEADTVFSNHRCHGHFLALGGDPQKLLAEIMSRKSGLCEGRGGSQHIHWKNFFTNGIQGGIVPNAVGVAFANKIDKNSRRTIVFLGDGTLGQGIVYESMNFAAVKEIPCIFVVEDNQYAMSTRRIDAISGNIADRISSFGIEVFEIESTDIDELEKFFANVFKNYDSNPKPICIVIHNYRLASHSKGDDTRDPVEIESHRKNDPIKIIRERIGDSEFLEKYESYRHEFLNLSKNLESEEVIKIEPIDPPKIQTDSLIRKENIRVVESIQSAFKSALESDPRIIFLGEDIRDPYGGAFKATKNLSQNFPDRIVNTPISESAIVGIGVGLAIAGKIPVVEIMFGDFLTLAFDQILNHATKYGWVYGVDVPLIIRTPMGARRGYGATHSQSLEKFLIGIPNLQVIALSPIHDPAQIYRNLFRSIKSPTIVIENKTLYAERIPKLENFQIEEKNSTMKLSLDESKPDVCLITYGGMIKETLDAAERLMLEEEIQVDLIAISQLSPIPIKDLEELIPRDSVIGIVEEGTRTAGIGAEIIASLIENRIGKKFFRIATPDLPIPNGVPLESQIIPNSQKIFEGVKLNVQ
ncbi:MAG: hypothetical protein IJ575_03815 [Selenomonadaceae bacterium]|nr:hypothetical protein [Selenomonadaceae bacterium]